DIRHATHLTVSRADVAAARPRKDEGRLGSGSSVLRRRSGRIAIRWLSKVPMVERRVIARLGSRGDGIADTAAGTLYVPYALPGESAEVEPWPGHADRRHLIKVDIASPDRIAPICPHFGVCGGCALQHLTTARYRDWKRALVVAALTRAGLDAPGDDLIAAPG